MNGVRSGSGDAIENGISSGVDGRVDRGAGNSAERDAVVRMLSRKDRYGRTRRKLLRRRNRRRANSSQRKPGKYSRKRRTTSISVQSNVVNLDAVVTDFDGNIIQGLQKQNFRVLDEASRSRFQTFRRAKRRSPIVMLMEFSKIVWADTSATKRKIGRTGF